MTTTLVLLIFPAAMILAASLDLFTMTIPNWLTAGLAAAFFALAPFAGLGAGEIAWHAATGATMLAVGFALFSFGAIGGGDAKLFAATALWLGWEHLLHYAILFAIIGGVLTVALLMARRMPLPEPLARVGWISRLHHHKTGIPYGIALAAGGLLVLPATGWMVG